MRVSLEGVLRGCFVLGKKEPSLLRPDRKSGGFLAGAVPNREDLVDRERAEKPAKV